MTSLAHAEIERRFMVRVRAWSAVAPAATREHLVQVYLSAEPERIARIRLHGESAVLTVKGESVDGARTEIECDVAADAARAIIAARLYTGTPVEKTRSTLQVGGLTWEVDQFEGGNSGLVIAEVEYSTDSGERAEWERRVDQGRPEWLAGEVTLDARFSNSQLAMRPFASWPDPERLEVLRELES